MKGCTNANTYDGVAQTDPLGNMLGGSISVIFLNFLEQSKWALSKKRKSIDSAY